MSTTIFAKQNPSPTVTTRRPLQTNDDIGNGSQRTNNRRSLSVKLRDLFRKDAAAANRSNDNINKRSPGVTPVRQNSPSPGPGQISDEAPHLRAPTISWPFGKKKPKSLTTSTTKASKTKTKDNRKTKQTGTASSTIISSPIYEQENQSSIHGQNFVPRSPQFVHGSTERFQSPTTYNMTTTTTTREYRDYPITNQPQYTNQVYISDRDVHTPPMYISDRSRSPSMNRQRLSEYNFQREKSTSPISIPLADIEVIPTPQQKRKVDNISPYNNTQILVDKPPIYSQNSPYPISYVTSNPTQWKSTSSSTLNNTGVYSSSTQMDVDAPKLHTPSVPFGSVSSKKKSKASKSKTRTDGMTSSSTTINNLIQQNPIQPHRSWSNTYGSLPDAELVYDHSLKPLKPSTKQYPGLSAIVRHHLRPANVYYNDQPSTTITGTTTTAARTPPTNSHRLQRFETSTTTLNEFEQEQPWSQPSIYGSVPTNFPTQRYDGYIRPITPQQPYIQADITISRVDFDDAHRQPVQPQPTHQISPQSPTYRSSATIYTRDKHHYVDGGEIRTWSSQENRATDDYNNSYTKPYTYIEVQGTNDRQTDYYDHQIVPTKIKDTSTEYRYSPRAHEQERYEKQQEKKITEITHQNIPVEEESYEVSFEYERQHQQQYSYEEQKKYEGLHSTNRYSSNANVNKTASSSILTERDKIYDQIPRSYERTQETRHTMAPIGNSEPIIHTYRLKRSNSYDGLGIMISADSDTRVNHFIREVEPNSPGYLAGLRKNDRIISINDVNVENVDFSNVLMLIKQGLDNDNLQISVIHTSEYN
ncbi:unnamed protein product [Adineta steineri]|uniref:PDZ domain-containing protein n=1 Tax=Adineta steineri TaxID=433720 RepID=A0A818HG68_9BILA|nr:unnamed protein product [Adineta steineri]